MQLSLGANEFQHETIPATIAFQQLTNTFFYGHLHTGACDNAGMNMLKSNSHQYIMLTNIFKSNSRQYIMLNLDVNNSLNR